MDEPRAEQDQDVVIPEATEFRPASDTTADTAPASRRTALLVLGGLVVLLAAFFVMAFAPKGDPAGGILPNDPAGYMLPDVTLEQLDGTGPLALSSLRGKPVVVNFWASWCTTCKDEAALLGKVEKQWRDKGVVFIGIDSSDKDAEAKAFEAKYGMDYTSIIDRDGLLTPKWGVTGYPETFFVGRDGRIVSKFISAIDAESLDAGIRSIL